MQALASRQQPSLATLPRPGGDDWLAGQESAKPKKWRRLRLIDEGEFPWPARSSRQKISSTGTWDGSIYNGLASAGRLRSLVQRLVQRLIRLVSSSCASS
jgi:hypothetical protein